MSYYLVSLPNEKCGLCGKKATVRLHRSGTDGRGAYCKRCGDRKVRELNAEEDRIYPSGTEGTNADA